MHRYVLPDSGAQAETTYRSSRAGSTGPPVSFITGSQLGIHPIASIGILMRALQPMRLPRALTGLSEKQRRITGRRGDSMVMP